MKRLALLCLSIILVGTHAAVASQVSDEMQASSTKFNDENLTDHLGYLAFPRSSGLDVRDSFLLGMTLDGSGKPTAVATCDSISDVDCLEMTDFTVAAILPVCSVAVNENCLREFYAETAEGKRLQVIDKGPFTIKGVNHFEGSSKIGMPSGSAPHLYQIPDAPHIAGDLYLPVVSRSGHWNRSLEKMTEFDNTSISLYAVKIENGSYSLFLPSTSAKDYLTRNQINTSGADSNCVYNDRERCAVAVPIPTKTRFGFQVVYSSLTQRWFHGRVENAQIAVRNEGKATMVDVLANPVKSTGFFTLKKRLELPQNLIEEEARKIGKGSCTSSESRASCYDSNLWQTEQDMRTFLQWLEIAGDRATFDPTIWTVNALNQSLDHPRTAICTPSEAGLVGLVSTNATQYIAGPPSYDSTSGELQYKVAAPHLRADGTLFRGSYDLVMDAKFARCLYSLSGDVIRASISVTSDAGTTVSATTNQGAKDGWLYLSAKEFTFSTPTIRVNLEGDSTKSEVTTTTASKKKVVKCVKGSKVVTVKRNNPKCPKGFRKT